ncbi:MAG: tyrosinase family protein [bacterium]|nr:tyrosinase family protein [bacterium]
MDRDDERPAEENGGSLPPGEVRRFGDHDTWLFILFEDGSAQGWWDWADPPLRKWVRFERTADNGLVPKPRGAPRLRILNEVGGILDRTGPFRPDNPDVRIDGEFDGTRAGHRRGRPSGTRLDRELTRHTMAKVRAENPDESVTLAYEQVADLLGISSWTVRDHLYKPDPGQLGTPACAPRPINPHTPWDRNWDSWQVDLGRRAEWLAGELAELDGDDEGTTLEEDLERLRAEVHEFQSELARAELARVIYNARLTVVTMDTLCNEGYDREAILNAMQYFMVSDAEEVDAVYCLGQACNEAEPDAPLFLHPKWIRRVVDYITRPAP